MHWCLPKLRQNSQGASLLGIGGSSPADSTSTLCDDPKSDPDSKDCRGIGIAEKLSALRKLMKDEPQPLDYYIIPSADAHQSEYIATVDARVEYISDFTSSSAPAIVSTVSAHLFVDSRYWIQAARETNHSYWTVHRVGAPGEKT
ncbi:hypothetical protein FRB94_014031 [Tulasnella sp. JGI-2019a]|nr:hypothetical protein FRB94_014031 [Tulasnella sp. JGI-2019a]